jgi:hypothetical protein
MILPLSLVAVALAILLLLLYLDGGHHFSVGGMRMDDLAGRTRPVDIDAFRNLVDPKEDGFLRANLRPREFRAIQRERARSAMDYIHNTTHNAAYLLAPTRARGTIEELPENNLEQWNAELERLLLQ